MQLRVTLPPSFPFLLLTGFILVAIPLLGSILGISYLLDKVAQQGQRSVTLSAEITLVSRQLAEAGRSFQRAAGQYFVLEDPALKQRLSTAHQRFVETLDKLDGMPWEQPQLLTDLAVLEADLYARMQAEPKIGSKRFDALKDDFEQLSKAQALIEEQAEQVVQHQVDVMRNTADSMQRNMAWLAFGLILLSMLLATFLSWFISRPVQQLAEVILRLGKNDLETQSTVHGPRDMVYLGKQLDWLRRRLQELESSKLQFFREVSHELKTPLTNLLEGLSLLRDEVVGELSSQQAEIVEIMVTSTDDLRQRIEDLLCYNEALRQTALEFSQVDLRTLVRDVLQRFDLQLRVRHLQVIEAIGSIQFIAHQEGLSTALENLISNALKYSPEAGIIEVTAKVHMDRLTLLIRDQGPGVPESEVAQLFQPFFRGSAPLAPIGLDRSGPERRKKKDGRFKSSGLGLAIAKTYIERQGGQLSLITTPDWGACFQITLPLREEERTIHA